uniref:Uncharacterized protein n=1 Tax=Trichogramma kaykai TaxID=54128 RepID=A0ABD2W2J2_9HYME
MSPKRRLLLSTPVSGVLFSIQFRKGALEFLAGRTVMSIMDCLKNEPTKYDNYIDFVTEINKICENINFKNAEDRRKFGEMSMTLFENWIDPLPDFKNILNNEDIENLLSDTTAFPNYNIFIDFLVRTELDMEKNIVEAEENVKLNQQEAQYNRNREVLIMVDGIIGNMVPCHYAINDADLDARCGLCGRLLSEESNFFIDPRQF